MQKSASFPRAYLSVQDEELLHVPYFYAKEVTGWDWSVYEQGVYVVLVCCGLSAVKNTGKRHLFFRNDTEHWVVRDKKTETYTNV
jgi:hypothetical protein